MLFQELHCKTCAKLKSLDICASYLQRSVAVTTNLFVLPMFGQAINLDDQGIYFVLNRNTGNIQTVIQLSYDNDDWYLYQLQVVHGGAEYRWVVMSFHQDSMLISPSARQIAQYFSNTEYIEPNGAWQLIKNADFGFGKFTPLEQKDDVQYAIIRFDGEDMHQPIRLHKASTDFMHALDESEIIEKQAEVEFA